MESYITWGALSALLILFSGVGYMWGIATRQVERPVLASWAVWALLGFLFLLTYYDAGARMDTTLPAAWMGFINPFIIMLLAFWYGQKGWSVLDSVCVSLAVITIVLWQTVDSALVGLTGVIVADTIGSIPQLKKSWTDPSDEPLLPWLCFCAGSGVNLFAVETWTIGHWLYPVYMTAGSVLITLPIIWYRLTRYQITQ